MRTKGGECYEAFPHRHRVFPGRQPACALLRLRARPEAPEVPPQSAQQSGAPEDSLPPEEAPPPAEEPEPPAPEPADDDFVRVQDYIPDIRVELKYATADNFTGTVIYGFSDAYLRYGTVKKLAAPRRPPPATATVS